MWLFACTAGCWWLGASRGCLQSAMPCWLVPPLNRCEGMHSLMAAAAAERGTHTGREQALAHSRLVCDNAHMRARGVERCNGCGSAWNEAQVGGVRHAWAAHVLASTTWRGTHTHDSRGSTRSVCKLAGMGSFGGRPVMGASGWGLGKEGGTAAEQSTRWVAGATREEAPLAAAPLLTMLMTPSRSRQTRNGSCSFRPPPTPCAA